MKQVRSEAHSDPYAGELAAAAEGGRSGAEEWHQEAEEGRVGRGRGGAGERKGRFALDSLRDFGRKVCILSVV